MIKHYGHIYTKKYKVERPPTEKLKSTFNKAKRELLTDNYWGSQSVSSSKNDHQPTDKVRQYYIIKGKRKSHQRTLSEQKKYKPIEDSLIIRRLVGRKAS